MEERVTFFTAESGRVRLRIKGHGAFLLSLSSLVPHPATFQCPQRFAGASAPMPQGSPELQDIVGGTDQRPFPPHVPQAAQQKLPEAAAVLYPVSYTHLTLPTKRIV